MLATQNPIESEGTYPLPEAQIDRFMLKVLVDYPAHDEELTVVQRSLERPPVARGGPSPRRAARAPGAGDARLRRPVADRVRSDARRGDAAAGRPRRRRRGAVHHRTARALAGRSRWSNAARALALLRGRDYVRPRRPAGARPRRVPAPARAVVPGARRGGRARPRSSTRCSRRCRRRRSTSGGALPRPHEGAHRRGRARRGRRRGPAPGRCPGRACAALELAIGRRVDGLLAGDYRSAFPGIGSELYQVRPYEPGDDVRRIEWNVTARTGRAARARRAGRARARHLARARRLGLDGVRHGRPAEGRRRRGRRARRRLCRDASREPARRSSRSAARRRAAPPAAGTRRRCSARSRRCATPSRQARGPLGEALALVDGVARAARARRRRLRLPRPARLARPAAARRRAPPDARGRDPRPARAGARRRRRAPARRSGDRPPAARRHERPQAARAVRGRGRRRARGARRDARLGRRPARRALDRGRLAPAARRVPAPKRKAPHELRVALPACSCSCSSRLRSSATCGSTGGVGAAPTPGRRRRCFRTSSRPRRPAAVHPAGPVPPRADVPARRASRARRRSSSRAARARRSCS